MKTKILLLLLVFHFSLLASFAQTSWRDSLAVLNTLIAQNPQSTDLRLRKAAVNIELQQWDYAIDEYGRVLQLDGNNLSALYFRAYSYNHQRRYDEARADYERFLAIMPRHFEARFGLAMTKRAMGRRLDTLDELNRLVELFPDSALSYAVRADYELELEQYDAALYDWNEALRLDPRNEEFRAARLHVIDVMGRSRRRR
ncbi:MAG: tetratricopeptide repeat protein [Prevotella sp.]|nr:tetratricopeptide repeat protein [Prevotella sp.]